MSDRERMSAERSDRGDRTEGQLDQVLGLLGEQLIPAPPLSEQLESELADLKPAPARRPGRRFWLVLPLSLFWGVAVLWMLELRPDLSGLPELWLSLYLGAWLAGFVLIGWAAMVPRAGSVMPNWRYAGVAAVLAGAGFVAAGLLFDRHVPGSSILTERSVEGFVNRAHRCLTWGMITACVPLALGVLALRGRVPVGGYWAGAGLGAAGGCLGGLMLHLHCHIADGLHLGLVHGGLVILSALIGALLIPLGANRSLSSE